MSFSEFYCFSGPWTENESAKINKYLDLARQLIKLWNMKRMMKPIVIGMCGTIPKGLEKKLEELEIWGRIKTIQTTVMLISERFVPVVIYFLFDAKNI